MRSEVGETVNGGLSSKVPHLGEYTMCNSESHKTASTSGHSCLERGPSIIIPRGFQPTLKDGNGVPNAGENPQEKTQQCMWGEPGSG